MSSSFPLYLVVVFLKSRISFVAQADLELALLVLQLLSAGSHCRHTPSFVPVTSKSDFSIEFLFLVLSVRALI